MALTQHLIGGIRELMLDENEREQMLIEKCHFLKVSQLLLLLIVVPVLPELPELPITMRTTKTI